MKYALDFSWMCFVSASSIWQILLIPFSFVLTSVSSRFIGVLRFYVPVRIFLIVIILPSKFSFQHGVKALIMKMRRQRVNEYLGAHGGSRVDIFC